LCEVNTVVVLFAEKIWLLFDRLFDEASSLGWEGGCYLLDIEVGKFPDFLTGKWNRNIEKEKINFANRNGNFGGNENETTFFFGETESIFWLIWNFHFRVGVHEPIQHAH
jgi:hypothetical protein